MIKFANPEYLYALAIIPLLALLLWDWFRTQRLRMQRVGDTRLVDHLSQRIDPKRRLARWTMWTAGMIFGIFAMAGLSVGSRYEKVKITGVDMVIALDISASMGAEDIKPNRLEKAKHEIGTLLSQLGGDRVALVIFAGQAFIQCPMTSDYSAVRMFLDAIDVQSTTAGGTNFAEMLEVARSAFPKPQDVQGPATGKAIVIFSDGEDHSDEATEKAKALLGENIRIFAVGVATENAVPIPVYDDRTGQTDFKKFNGSVVTTKREDAMLTAITDMSGGAYYQATINETEIQKIYDAISQLQKGESAEYQFTEYENQFQWFVGLSLIAVVFYIGIGNRKTESRA